MTQKNTDIEGKKPGSGLPSISIDWTRYEAYLAESDMSEQDKRAFVETLWHIMLAFVDLGFGLDPTGQACGQMRDVLFPPDSNALELENTNSENQLKSNHAAQGGQR